MDDLISRAEAIDAIIRHESESYITINNLIDKDEARAIIEDLPSAQPKLLLPWEVLVAQAVLPQPKRGKWIRDGHHIRCDQCGMYICDTDREGDRIPTEFCPNCGADMREVTNGN